MKSKFSRLLILIGTLTTLVTTVACSSKPKPTVVTKVQPASFVIRPEAPKSVAFTAETTPTKVVEKAATPVKPQSKYVSFKSRDYGVSFEYPWQYTRLGAKAIADDYSLQPQSDGLASQLTLVRVEVPKGFYPGTDFDSGYFMLSLNPDLKQDECESTLKVAKGNNPQKVNINGVEYKWMETNSGGHGESAKVRDYVAFVNDTCYELETGVKTKNDGLSREVDPDQVLKRLDPILVSVKIDSGSQFPAKQQLQSSKEVPTTDSGK